MSQDSAVDQGETTSVDRGRATSVEMDAEVAAVLGYLLSFLAAIVVVAGEEENEFVRFHVFQSVTYNLLAGVALVGLVGVGTAVVSVSVLLVFLLVGPVTVLAAVSNGGAVAGTAMFVLFFVVMVLFALSFGVTFILALLPFVAIVPILGYLVYAAYRASQGDRYEMPWIGEFVEQYV